MEWIMNVPVVAKILVSLAIVLVGNRIINNLSISLILGILVLAFWSGHPVSSVFTISWVRLSGKNQLFLYLIIYLVIGLSSQMKKTGTIDVLVKGVQSRLSRRGAMAVLPALIGLLPMPGGAVFSAPLVDSCDDTGGTRPILKSRINFWFRHLWEFWWPLYPGVLLAVELSGIEVPIFSSVMFPMTVFYIIGGYFFLLRKVPKEKKEEKEKEGGILGPIVPIIIILTIYILIMVVYPSVAQYTQYLPMAIGIITAMVFLQIRHPIGWEDWKSILFSIKTLQLIVLVMLIRIYGAFIEAPLPDGMYLMEKMRGELFTWGIPVILFTMLIPLFSGIATGIAIGTVGASMPIVLSLMGSEPELSVKLSTVLLAYSFGHVGMMLSPVHICLIVTNRYYETGLFRSLKGLLQPSLVVMISAFILSRLILYVL